MIDNETNTDDTQLKMDYIHPWYRDRFAPENSIAHDIEVVDGAFLDCRDVQNARLDHGVYDGKGALQAASLFRYNPQITQLPLHIDIAQKTRNSEIPKLTGTYLLAGQASAHFGHNVTESFAGLWALDHVQEKIDGLIFYDRSPNLTSIGEGSFRSIFKIFDINLPVYLVNAPTQIERLIIPRRGSGLFEMAQASPEYRDFMRKHLAKVPPAPYEKVYVSRSAIRIARSGTIGEKWLESKLTRQGYVIFRPEIATPLQQLSVYKGAKHIIGIEGSAFHWVANIADENTHIYVMQRRFGDDEHTIRDQLKSWTPKHFHSSRDLEWMWIRRRRLGGFSMIYEVRAEEVLSDLCALGFVDKSVGIEALPREERVNDMKSSGVKRFEKIDRNMKTLQIVKTHKL